MDRDTSGKFTEGHPGGPGRPRKSVEERYLKKLSSTITMKDWSEICKRAVYDAKRGDSKARQWISDYLMGKPVQRNEITGADGGVIVVKFGEPIPPRSDA